MKAALKYAAMCGVLYGLITWGLYELFDVTPSPVSMSLAFMAGVVLWELDRRQYD